MIYSKTSANGLRALSYLASKPRGRVTTVREVRERLDIPAAYAAKIFQCLARAKILNSCRGSSGGYRLAVDPSKLSLIKVIRVLDDLSSSPLSNCVMGLEKCGARNPCPLHFIWAKTKDQLAGKLKKVTVSEMAKMDHRAKWGALLHPSLSKGMKTVFGRQTKLKKTTKKESSHDRC